MAVQSRTTIGLQPWIFRHKRAIYTKILRLRSGHNKLNDFIGKWDPNTDQHCPHGCPQTENAKHVLLECHAFKEERKTMETAFRLLNTPMELPSILGLNPNLPKSTQTIPGLDPVAPPAMTSQHRKPIKSNQIKYVPI